MIVALYTLIFMIIKFIMHYQQTTIPSLRRAALSNVRSNASLNHASWGENGWPIFFCWSGLFLLSQCMVLQVPQFNVAITLSFQPVICFWRNLWTDSCSLRTRPYQKYGKGSQGAVCEGIQWKVSDWWWLLFLHKSGKWGPPKLVSVELWEEDGRRAYMCTHIYIYIYLFKHLTWFMRWWRYSTFSLCVILVFHMAQRYISAVTSCDTWKVGIWRSRSSRCFGMDSRFGAHVQLV